MLRYQLRQLDVFSDFDLGLKVLAKGKLILPPPKISNQRVMKRIFEASGGDNHGGGR